MIVKAFVGYIGYWQMLLFIRCYYGTSTRRKTTKKRRRIFTGLTKISDTVYRKLAGLLAMEVKGVAGMSTTFSEGISEWVGIKNEYEGVRIKWRPDKTLSVELYVILLMVTVSLM